MPTSISRQYLSILVLLSAVAALAQDLHIKKSITVGGNVVSTSETSIKGARERTTSQGPTGNTVTVRQCDLKRTLNLNEQAQTYLIVNDPLAEPPTKAGAKANAPVEPTSGAYITETSTVTDTGERKTLYGYPVRHLKTKVTLKSSPNACTPTDERYDIDGWYADISKEFASCPQVLRPVGQIEGCTDPVIHHRSGSAKAGYPLEEIITLHNGDGGDTEVGIRVTEITKQAFDKALFDVPAGFREVQTEAALNAAPVPQAAPPQPTTAYAQPTQQPMPQGGQNNAIQRPSAASVMFNPAAALALQQQAMAMAQQNGMGVGRGGSGGNMMNPGGMQGAAAAAPNPAPLGPKQPGKIRIGVAPPDAQVGQGNNAGGDYSTPIRNAEVALMSGPAIEVAPLDAHVPMQLQAEAQQKQCDYVMYSSVSVKHPQASGFGKFAKYGSMAASITPMGMMAHGVASAAAAQAAGMAASQMAQQQAVNALSGFNGQIKSKDDVTVQYQLIATGQSSPVIQSTLQGRAKTDGEDVLTPLLQQTANAVLTQVAHK
jgi:hypothetical protein